MALSQTFSAVSLRDMARKSVSIVLAAGALTAAGMAQAQDGQTGMTPEQACTTAEGQVNASCAFDLRSAVAKYQALVKQETDERNSDVAACGRNRADALNDIDVLQRKIRKEDNAGKRTALFEQLTNLGSRLGPDYEACKSTHEAKLQQDMVALKQGGSVSTSGQKESRSGQTSFRFKSYRVNGLDNDVAAVLKKYGVGSYAPQVPASAEPSATVQPTGSSIHPSQVTPEAVEICLKQEQKDLFSDRKRDNMSSGCRDLLAVYRASQPKP